MRDEAVVSRIAHRRIEKAVHNQVPAPCPFRFDRLAANRHFNDNIDLMRGILPVDIASKRMIRSPPVNFAIGPVTSFFGPDARLAIPSPLCQQPQCPLLPRISSQLSRSRFRIIPTASEVDRLAGSETSRAFCTMMSRALFANLACLADISCGLPRVCIRRLTWRPRANPREDFSLLSGDRCRALRRDLCGLCKSVEIATLCLINWSTSNFGRPSHCRFRRT